MKRIGAADEQPAAGRAACEIGSGQIARARRRAMPSQRPTTSPDCGRRRRAPSCRPRPASTTLLPWPRSRAVAGMRRRAAGNGVRRGVERAGPERESAGVARRGAGDERVQHDVVRRAGAIAPLHRDDDRLRRSGRARIDVALDAIDGVCRAVGGAVDGRCVARDRRVRASRRSGIDGGEGAQLLHVLAAEAKRFGALARDVAAEAQVTLHVGDRRACSRPARRRRRATRAGSRRADRGARLEGGSIASCQKSFQLPLTRTTLPSRACRQREQCGVMDEVGCSRRRGSRLRRASHRGPSPGRGRRRSTRATRRAARRGSRRRVQSDIARGDENDRLDRRCRAAAGPSSAGRRRRGRAGGRQRWRRDRPRRSRPCRRFARPRSGGSTHRGPCRSGVRRSGRPRATRARCRRSRSTRRAASPSGPATRSASAWSRPPTWSASPPPARSGLRTPMPAAPATTSPRDGQCRDWRRAHGRRPGPDRLVASGGVVFGGRRRVADPARERARAAGRDDPDESRPAARRRARSRRPARSHQRRRAAERDGRSSGSCRSSLRRRARRPTAAASRGRRRSRSRASTTAVVAAMRSMRSRHERAATFELGWQASSSACRVVELGQRPFEPGFGGLERLRAAVVVGRAALLGRDVAMGEGDGQHHRQAEEQRDEEGGDAALPATRDAALAHGLHPSQLPTHGVVARANAGVQRACQRRVGRRACRRA